MSKEDNTQDELEAKDIYQMTFDDIVADMQKEIAEQWSNAEKTNFFLSEYGNNNLIDYHHSLGRYIRNKYKLWNKKWEPLIINGSDHSPDHPDNISMKMIEEIWKKGLPEKK